MGVPIRFGSAAFVQQDQIKGLALLLPPGADLQVLVGGRRRGAPLRLWKVIVMDAGIGHWLVNDS